MGTQARPVAGIQGGTGPARRVAAFIAVRRCHGWGPATARTSLDRPYWIWGNLCWVACLSRVIVFLGCAGRTAGLAAATRRAHARETGPAGIEPATPGFGVPSPCGTRGFDVHDG